MGRGAALSSEGIKNEPANKALDCLRKCLLSIGGEIGLEVRYKLMYFFDTIKIYRHLSPKTQVKLTSSDLIVVLV